MADFSQHAQVEDVRKRLGLMAKSLRMERGLTQKAVAAELRVPKDAISMFEKHGERLGIDKIDLLFRFYGYHLSAEKKTIQIPPFPDLSVSNNVSLN